MLNLLGILTVSGLPSFLPSLCPPASVFAWFMWYCHCPPSALISQMAKWGPKEGNDNITWTMQKRTQEGIKRAKKEGKKRGQKKRAKKRAKKEGKKRGQNFPIAKLSEKRVKIIWNMKMNQNIWKIEFSFPIKVFILTRTNVFNWNIQSQPYRKSESECSI